MSPRLRALALNLLLSTLSLGLGLAAVEAGLRLTAPPARGGKEQLERERYVEHHPLLGWRKTAGARAVYERRDYRSEFTINGKGLRGPDRPYERNVGLPRVLALGDSFVEAFMLDDEGMLTARMEAHLAERGCRAEVLNGGTAGYSTDQEYLFYREEGRRYRPDVVVLFVYHNDIPALVVDHHDVLAKPVLDFSVSPPAVKNAPLPRQPLERAPRKAPPAPPPPRSYLLELVKERLEGSSARTYNRLARAGLWEPLRQLPMNEELLLYHVPELGHQRQAWSQFTWTLETLAAAVREDGGRLLVAYVPSRMEVSRAHWEATEARYGLDAAGFDRGAVAARVAAIASRLGLPATDLTAPLARADGLFSPVYFPTDSHWNARGQDVAAAAVSDLLAGQGFLPGCEGR